MSERQKTLVEALASALGRCRSVELPAEVLGSPVLVAKVLREHGMPAQSFAMCEPGASAFDLGYPFIYICRGTWRIYLPPGAGEDELPPEVLVSAYESIEPGAVIVGYPPVGHRFRLLMHDVTPWALELPDVLVAYGATSDDAQLAEEQFYGELQALHDKAKEHGRELVFIDAVGLIPESTIEGHGGDEQVAFERALAAIRSETESIGQGRIYPGPSPLWSAVHRWLAERRVPCVLEDLNYELWKEIVQFDSLELAKRALTMFLSGFPEQAAKSMHEHIEGFHGYNCRKRSLNLRNQVAQMLDTTRPPVVAILREIGHYGMLEALLGEQHPVQSKILGCEPFSVLLKAPGLEVLGKNMGVKISPQAVEGMMLRLCLVPCLMRGRNMSLRQVARLLDTCRLDSLDSQTMAEVLEELNSPIFLSGRRRGQNAMEQLFHILKDRGLVPDGIAEVV